MKFSGLTRKQEKQLCRSGRVLIYTRRELQYAVSGMDTYINFEYSRHVKISFHTHQFELFNAQFLTYTVLKPLME